MNYTTKSGTPSAFITLNKQRVKQYGQNVYLQDGSEFEIELFNPLTKSILSKIKINGNYISGGGIVLKPGQRVFLERYLDDPKKFKFETYEVDGSSNEVLDAIRKNGDVVIEFYEEESKQSITYYPNLGNLNTQPYWWDGNGTTNPYYVGTTLTTNFGDNVNTFVNNVSSDTLSFNTTSINTNHSNPVLPKETGRVEKGDHSKQLLTTVNMDFNRYSSYSSQWKILPLSEKPYETNDLKVYCTECGAKRKKSSHKFCPHCGTKY
jgi:ribosomal protein L44E